RHRAPGRDLLEPLLTVVGLDDLRTELSANPRGETKISGIASELSADRRDPQHRDAVPVARVDEPRHVLDRLRLVLPTDEDLHCPGVDVHAPRVLKIEGEALVRQVPEDARATARAYHEPAGVGRRDRRAQRTPGQHERIRLRSDRDDPEVEPLEA